MMAMIDKLDVRVPRRAPFRRQFAELYEHIALDDARLSMEGKPMRRRSSRYYESVLDLREFGHELILHGYARLSKSGDHKVELVDTGKTGLSHMLNEISRIFDVDPEKLAIIRVDLTVDVPGIPVPWFSAHCRAQYKRWSADIGRFVDDLEYSQMGIKVLETFYLGKRPNVYRIYNKNAEREYEYKQFLRKANREKGIIPSFEDMYGCPRNSILTRVERQIGGGRLPPQLDTVKKLRFASSFNPFERLRFVAGCENEPQPSDYRSDVYRRGIQIRQEILEQGLQRVRYMLNEQSMGNADRILSTVADFIPAGGHRMTSEELYGRYQESICKQVRA